MERDVSILHLADLHFGNASDPADWFALLGQDLELELHCARIDAVVLSGDIAVGGQEHEYDAASTFVAMLLERFALKTDQIVIVPGNHDVNWDNSRNAYEFVWEDDYDGKCDPERSIDCGLPGMLIRDEQVYTTRFEHFAAFYANVRRQRYPRQYLNQGIIYEFPEHKLLFLGLNSAWNVDHHYQDRADIKQVAVANALIKLHSRHEDWLKIAVWHHPLQSASGECIKTDDFFHDLVGAGFRVVLHGHVHAAENHLYYSEANTQESQIHTIAAGTFGSATRPAVPDYPWHYNFITIKGDTVRVHTRKRTEPHGVWSPDTRWKSPSNDQLLAYYECHV